MDRYEKVLEWKRKIHYRLVDGDNNCSNCAHATTLLLCALSADAGLRFRAESFMICGEHEEMVVPEDSIDDGTS